jgi:hypothetical protein
MGFDKFDTQFDNNFRLDDLFRPRFKFWFFKQSNLQINGKGLLLISAWNIVSEEKIQKSQLQEEICVWILMLHLHSTIIL